MGRGKSTVWLHVTNITGKEGYVKCVHCGHDFFASNATRVRDHFTKGKVCESADASLLKEMEEMEALSTKKNKQHKTASRQTTEASDDDDVLGIDDDPEDDAPRKVKRTKQTHFPTAAHKALLNDAQAKIARLFYAEGIALRKADSPFLDIALQACVALGNAGFLPNMRKIAPSAFLVCFAFNKV